MKALDSEFSASDNSKSHLDLTKLSNEEYGALVLQRDVINGLLAGERSRLAAEAAARLTGRSTATIYRQRKRYIAQRNLLAFVKPKPTGGRGRSRLDPAHEEIIAQELKRFLRRCRGQEVEIFVKAVLARFREDESKPSARTIRRRFEAISERQKVAHWEGHGKASEQHNLQKGSTPKCSRPLERIQIDATRSDIWLASAEDGTPLGRPWVTLAIDEFSRVVLAVFVTFNAPSSDELAAVMALAALPKERWLTEYGCEDIDWPFYGVPLVAFTDRGVDFTAHAAGRGLESWGGRWEHRAQPHHGGIIERLIGTAMMQTRLLEGNTRFSKAKRHEDRVDPSKTAKLTRREYTRALIEFFGREYHHRVHPELGMSPHDMWHLGCLKAGEPTKVSDPFAFYLDFLPTVTPTVQKYGVRASFLEYRAPELQKILNAAKSLRVDVKIDPADVTRAFIKHPITGVYFEARSEPICVTSVTREEWEHHRRKCLKAAHGRKISRAVVEFSLRTGRLSLDEAKRQRQQNELKRTAPKSLRAAQRKKDTATQVAATSSERLPAPDPKSSQVKRSPINFANLTSLPTHGDVR